MSPVAVAISAVLSLILAVTICVVATRILRSLADVGVPAEPAGLPPASVLAR
ncbi:hypothetical protein [Catellatospora chokoriensis]|uniref:Uncharacterized protein n=1 Tax=Catellatospora chokoriensis TaxID=310353 RepID=A0A8J3NS14_9ACTN|nr:hypothetical protein [Catellatospora chokoriensis]GIF90702.1 hypothetical protein Cch02nite_41460 [Catellatospora chokoriensis]